MAMTKDEWHPIQAANRALDDAHYWQSFYQQKILKASRELEDFQERMDKAKYGNEIESMKWRINLYQKRLKRWNTTGKRLQQERDRLHAS